MLEVNRQAPAGQARIRKPLTRQRRFAGARSPSPHQCVFWSLDHVPGEWIVGYGQARDRL